MPWIAPQIYRAFRTLRNIAGTMRGRSHLITRGAGAAWSGYNKYRSWAGRARRWKRRYDRLMPYASRAYRGYRTYRNRRRSYR